MILPIASDRDHQMLKRGTLRLLAYLKVLGAYAHERELPPVLLAHPRVLSH